MLIVILLLPVVAAAIGYAAAEDKDEELLFLRLLGHGFLGYFTFTIQRGPALPVGFPLALWLASRAETNRTARYTASGITFAAWLLGLILN